MNKEFNYNNKELGQKIKNIVQEFFTELYELYDNRNLNIIDKFVKPDFRLFGKITNTRTLKEGTQNLLNVFPDLKHTTEYVIAEGQFVVIFNKWTSNKGNCRAADILKIENNRIVEWDEVAFFSREMQNIIEKDIPEFIQDYIDTVKDNN